MAHDNYKQSTAAPLLRVAAQVTLGMVACGLLAAWVFDAEERSASITGSLIAWGMSLISLFVIFRTAGDHPRKLGIAQFASIAARMFAGVILMLVVKLKMPQSAAPAMLSFAGVNFFLLLIESVAVVKQVKAGYAQLKGAGK